MTLISKSSLPIQIFHRDLHFPLCVCGSSNGSPENKPLVISIYIKILVTTNVYLGGRGVGQEVYWNLQCSHYPYSNPEVVEQEIASSKNSQMEYEHELGCVPQ